MASQYDATREYGSVDESELASLRMCPQCKVNAVPRGITSTRIVAHGEKSCPNCGYVFGRPKNFPSGKVTGIVVTGADGATTITVNNKTLQMVATIYPKYADNKAVVWSVVAGETGTATISASGLLTPGANGIVTVKATAADGSGIVGSLDITMSNQV